MFEEDLSAFFNTADFAEQVWLEGATPVLAIFHEPYTTPLGLVASSNPWLECRTVDIDKTHIGKPIGVREVAYTIANVEPDGTGKSVVQLELA